MTTQYPGGSFVAGLELDPGAANAFTGRSGFLVPDVVLPYTYKGDLESDGLHLDIFGRNDKSPVGTIVLRARSGKLSGKGTLHGLPIALDVSRPLKPPAAPVTHDFAPQVYYRTFSGANPPALHIFPGDTVRTKTVDATGRDEHDEQKSFSGNPQTGPFYIEGAMVGDTIAVHFLKIRPNRDTAFEARGSIQSNVLPPGFPQERTENWSNIWQLDRAAMTGSPANPSDKLKNFSVKLIPMLGCAAVAPYPNTAQGTGELGFHGGNLDYNQINEGTTLYLPVYQAGALLSVGDGHALQEDGEITGQGFETSMDVEFRVDLIKDQNFDQPWAENGDFVMVSGIGGSLESAMQFATAGMTNWLRATYGLSFAEAVTVMASSVHYDIAEVVDLPDYHVVAKIKKDVLAELPKPEKPSAFFCQPFTGCTMK